MVEGKKDAKVANGKVKQPNAERSGGARDSATSSTAEDVIAGMGKQMESMMQVMAGLQTELAQMKEERPRKKREDAMETNSEGGWTEFSKVSAPPK